MNNLHFTSLLEALAYFKSKETFIGFETTNHSLQHPITKKLYPFDSISFLNTYKFEDDSDADAISLLHVVETKDGTKGIFVDASGIYSNLDYIVTKRL